MRGASSDAAEPTPEDAAALADELEWVFRSSIPSAGGCWSSGCRAAVPEIADDTGRSERSVRRTLARIRSCWPRTAPR